jgi:hypothetical protein
MEKKVGNILPEVPGTVKFAPERIRSFQYSVRNTIINEIGQKLLQYFDRKIYGNGDL